MSYDIIRDALNRFHWADFGAEECAFAEEYGKIYSEDWHEALGFLAGYRAALSSSHHEAREEALDQIDDAFDKFVADGFPDDEDKKFVRDGGQWMKHLMLPLLSRLAAQKDEGRTISWQLINDIIDETLEEEAAPLECAIQVILAANGYTAINEPATPEPRPAEEPVPAPGEEDAFGLALRHSNEWLTAVSDDYDHEAPQWAYKLHGEQKTEREALRSQLALKDEEDGWGGKIDMLKGVISEMREVGQNGSKKWRILAWADRLEMNLPKPCPLREPDGRKGE